ncbi:MAG TPA: prevent-host-death protein [Coriobacteriia bacterium]|nr:prevent-host-death protein [Coriobacteriia bacterium]
MDAMTVGELKANFSTVLDKVQAGETVEVLFGQARKPVAKIVPVSAGLPEKRPLGLLRGKATIEFAPDFKFSSVEDFLGQK